MNDHDDPRRILLDALQQAVAELNYGMAASHDEGEFARLVAKHFPLGEREKLDKAWDLLMSKPLLDFSGLLAVRLPTYAVSLLFAVALEANGLYDGRGKG